MELATDLLRRGGKGDAGEAAGLFERAAEVGAKLKMPVAQQWVMLAAMATTMPDELGRILREKR